jgi:regulator of protease activity HflC (stomatin/prohibitin superfamily)
MAARPTSKSAQQRPRSKAAQATADAREARARAAAADDAWEAEAEAHPEGVRFEAKGKVDAKLYDKLLAGPDAEARRRMWRNAVLMAVVVLVPTIYLVSRMVAGG